METREHELLNSEQINVGMLDTLLAWLRENNPLSPVAKESFVDNNRELRLKMQAIVVEIQKKYISLIAEDVQFEEFMRADIRERFPYMTNKERIEASRALHAVAEDRWKRLETQMAGFDFFTNVEQAIQTLSEAKVSKDIKEQVKALPAKNRAKLVRLLDSIVEDNKDILEDKVTIVKENE